MKSAAVSKKNQPVEKTISGVRALGLAELGQLCSGDVVAFLCQDERPLLGLLGLWDWRLCGQLSRLLLEKHITGRAGQQLMTVLSDSDGSSCRLFVFGVGVAGKQNAEQVKQSAEQWRDVLKMAGSTKYKVILPESRSQSNLLSWFKETWTDSECYVIAK